MSELIDGRARREYVQNRLHDILRNKLNDENNKLHEEINKILLTEDKMLKLIKDGKVSLRPNIGTNWTLNQAYDFTKQNEEQKKINEKYRERNTKMQKIYNEAMDKFMLDDKADPAVIIADFEKAII
jgi:hypothetical protein